jgi:peptidoglycan/xylan/chitin deacetylase (PgdA/CDA1 family)
VHRPISRIVQVLLIPVLLLSSVTLASAQTASLTVAGTPAVNIRSCAALDCDVLAVAPLGSRLTPTGDPVDGFTPVEYGGVEGFAYSLYLIESGGDLWFREGQAGCNRIALIFNIGIGFEPSQAIVDTLVSTSTPATMFPMGYFASAQPAYVQQLHRAGFPIGTHGQETLDLTTLTPNQVIWDIDTSLQVIGRVIGAEPEPLFTPYAASSDATVRSVVASLGVLPIGWNVAATDFNWTATADIVYDEVMNAVYDGAIVEMHLDGPATGQSTAAALPRLITDLEAAGYTFVTIPEMILPCGAV